MTGTIPEAKADKTGLSGMETFVAIEAPAVGMTLGDLCDKTGVQAVHVHDCPPKIDTRAPYERDRKVEAHMGIHVWGSATQLRNFVALVNVQA